MENHPDIFVSVPGHEISDDTRIARFNMGQHFKKIIGEADNSSRTITCSFSLGTSEDYENSSVKGIRDPDERRAKFKVGNTECSVKSCNNFLLSCWTYIGDIKDPRFLLEQTIANNNQDQNTECSSEACPLKSKKKNATEEPFVIVSTVGQVKNIFSQIVKTTLALYKEIPFLLPCVYYGQVKYHDDLTGETFQYQKSKIPGGSKDSLWILFNGNGAFREQYEIRFAAMLQDFIYKSSGTGRLAIHSSSFVNALKHPRISIPVEDYYINELWDASGDKSHYLTHLRSQAGAPTEKIYTETL